MRYVDSGRRTMPGPYIRDRYSALAVAREVNPSQLRGRFVALRGSPERPADLSVVIPVNARADLRTALQILADLAGYNGHHTLEIILIINNYPPHTPPAEVAGFRDMGLRVIAVPDVRPAGAAIPGEEVALRARIPGVRASTSEVVVLPDADNRIPNATALLDWCFDQLNRGAQLVHFRTPYYEVADTWSMRFRIAVHYLVNWLKRSALRIPTTRGGDYAVRRSVMLQLFDGGALALDISLGPAIRAMGGQVVYSGNSDDRVVLTSGSKIDSGWREAFRYLGWRLRRNIEVLLLHHRAI
jgi:hypothetical protein